MPSATARPATERPASELLEALRRYWGYDAFRPLQERIVRSLLGGRDACVVMPTGGGKSLCYQLPAALSPDKTVMVISPLIALMQDQVAQLGQMGIPAALLNSSITRSSSLRCDREALARASIGCFIFHRNDWRGRTRSNGCSACRFCFSRLTRRIAFRNGATSSGRNTASSAACASIFRTVPSPPSRRAPRSMCGMTLFASSNCATPHKYIASFHRPICATW